MDGLLLALRVALSLACVLGLMWFVGRKVGRPATGRRRGELEVVARQGVGGKAQVVLLQTGGQRFLLGVTEQQVTVLHTAEAPAAAFAGALEGATADTARTVAAPPAGTRQEPSGLLPVDALTRPAAGGAWAAGSLLDAGTWKAAARAVTGRGRAA